MIVVGWVSQKMVLVLCQIYDQMVELKWVLVMGVCVLLGGMFNNYVIVQGVDYVVLVDIYLFGCLLCLEMLLYVILKLYEKIQQMLLGINWECVIVEVEEVVLLVWFIIEMCGLL